jgi:hypothetical protein
MMNDDITEIGSVTPVITVERQELMKQKTIRIVRIPPRIRVCLTSSRDSRMKRELSRTTEIVIPGGSSVRMLSAVRLTASATSTMLAPACFRMSNDTAGAPLTSASERRSSTPSLTSATSPRRIGLPLRTVIAISRNCSTRSGFPETRRLTSVAPRFRRPRGVLTFSDLSPATTASTPSPSALSRSGSMITLTSRFAAPTRSTLPTPAIPSKRRLTLFSTRTVRSRGESVSDRTASDTMGMALKSSFWIIGSSIPLGRMPRMALTLARASWVTSLSFSSRRNSTTTVETPSRE